MDNWNSFIRNMINDYMVGVTIAHVTTYKMDKQRPKVNALDDSGDVISTYNFRSRRTAKVFYKKKILAVNRTQDVVVAMKPVRPVEYICLRGELFNSITDEGDENL